jgi:excisionase family DNA binding protein
MTITHETLLPPGEVAAMFRVDPRTVTRWAQTGKLTSIRTLGGHRRYRETEVRGLLATPGDRPALGHVTHSISVEIITPALRSAGDLPADAHIVITERHGGRVTRFCSTDQDVIVPEGVDTTAFMVQIARNVAAVTGATFVEVAA